MKHLNKIYVMTGIEETLPKSLLWTEKIKENEQLQVFFYCEQAGVNIDVMVADIRLVGV